MAKPTLIALAFDPEAPWFRGVFPGVVRYAEEQGWLLEFLLHGETKPFRGQIDGVVRSWHPVGILSPRLPQVFLASRVPPFVSSDHLREGGCAARHLIERGYQHLFFLQTRDTRDPVPVLRERGFVAAAQEGGRSVEIFTEGLRTRRRKRWVLEDQLLDLADRLRTMPKPIGACACNPQHIQRLHHVCVLENLRIPEDVAIVSPTDNSSMLPHLRPGISAVRHEDEAIGYETARLLHQRMLGHSVPDETFVPPREIIVRGSTDHRVVEDALCGKIVSYIWDHLEKSPDTAELARRFHLSERTLYRRFREHLGRTPSEELRHARIETAKRLLQTTSLRLIEIAMVCGYGGQSQFNRDFKAATGRTPGALRA